MGSVAETKLCGGQSHKVNDVIKSVRDIEIRARRLSDGLVTGAYLSRFKGSGLDFTEIRRYEPGDDIRAIDWNVTARMGYPYIKEFIEERDIAVYLVVDISGSADFGTQKALKSDMAIELCASVAYSAMKNNDRVGMLLFSDKVEKFVKLGKGRKHMMRIIHEIVKFNPESRMTDLREPLRFLSRVIKQKSIIFIVSDFIDDVNNYSKELGLLARDHDVIAIDLYDAREMSIPDIGYIELEDGETGEQMLVDTSDPQFRKSFEKNVEISRDNLTRFMRRKKINRLEVFTSGLWVKSLIGFFKSRQKGVFKYD